MRHFRLIAVLCLALVPAVAPAASLDGTVQWSKRVELASRFSGVIDKVAVQAGERVGKDQLLLALEETPFASAVRIAEAAAARRGLDRDEARRDYQQAKELYERKVLSTVELDSARLKHGRAEASWREAQAELDRARFRLRHSALRAPFAAVVLARAAEPGQTVNVEVPAPPLLVLAAAGEYIVRARLPAERVSALKLGQTVPVSVAGRNYSGQIQSLARDAQAAADGGALLEVRFETPEATLQPGQAARIELP